MLDIHECCLQVFRGYLSLLAEANQTPPDAAAANGDAAMDEQDTAENAPVYSPQESRKAWHTRTLAALGAFLRKHYIDIAAVTSQIEQEAADGVSPDVEEVVLRNLHL